jgi:hypothetical protein
MVSRKDHLPSSAESSCSDLFHISGLASSSESFLEDLFADNAFLASSRFCAIASRRLMAGLGSGGAFSGDGCRRVGLDGVDFVRDLPGDTLDVPCAVGVLARGVLGVTSLAGDLVDEREITGWGMRDIATVEMLRKTYKLEK